MSVDIRIGDCRDVLPTLAADSVDCVVTSPPYWRLRDYGIDGQIGAEPTLAEYVETLVAVFAAVHRVLKPDGTCWLNLGDCYAGSWGAQGRAKIPETLSGDQVRAAPKAVANTGTIRDPGLKPKDLCMVPARVALALQTDGWWLRSEIVWSKPNPMPESIADRPSCAHEKLFLLTKSPRYAYDADAVRSDRPADNRPRKPGIPNPDRNDGGRSGHRTDKQRGHSRRHAGFNERWDAMSRAEQQTNGANLRNVWTIPNLGFSEAHFATFPPELVEPCIRAGCLPGGVVLDPFAGSGTVGMVADRLQRDAILIELNPEYAAMAERRVRGDAPLFAEVSGDA